MVEDDGDLNRAVCSFLNQNGYNTESFLNAMYSNTFDLIISETMMPYIDRFEFAKTVRALNADITILFMTACDEFASKQSGYRIGIDDCMVNTIEFDELFLRISALLRRSHRFGIGKLKLDADERTAFSMGKRSRSRRGNSTFCTSYCPAPKRSHKLAL